MRLAIGIDLGGTQLRAALVREDGAILERAAVATAARAGPVAVIAQMRDCLERVATGIDRRALAGCGVSPPGPLDSETGTTLGVPTLAGFTDLPFARLVAEALGLPVRLENDGSAAALGEWRFGAGRGLNHLVYVTVSTGIGGGVVCDGRLLRGRRGMAAEIGHMTIARDGLACACGNRGCWEAYASGTAFCKRASGDAGAVFAAAAAGDARAQTLVAEEARYLGVGLVNLAHLYSPEIIIVGGGMAQNFSGLEPGMLAHFQRFAMPAFRDVLIVPAALGGNSGVIGAAALIFDTEAP